MDDKTAKLRSLRLAKEQAEKRSLQARKAVRESTQQQAIQAMFEELGRRARQSNKTGQADPLLDHIFGIKS